MKTDKEKAAGTHILQSYGFFLKKQYQEYLVMCENTFLLKNKTFLPIMLEMKPSEHILISELMASDNTIMTKVLGVLSSLCIEVAELKKEAFERHFIFLALYEEYSESNIVSQMESICWMNAFITHCNDTLQNLCSQVFAVVSECPLTLKQIQLHYIINNIGELFTIIVLIELMISRTSLPTKWNNFWKNIKAYVPETLDIYEDKYKAMLGAVENISFKIMSDDIVQNTLHQLLTLRKNSLVGNNCMIIASEFTQYLKQALINLDKFVQEKPNTNNMYKCIKINALFVLNSHLFGSSDKKTFKVLVDLNSKVCK